MLKCIGLLIVAISLTVCTAGWAGEEATDTPAATEKSAQAKVTGISTATDAVTSVVDKADALLTGNLSITMEPDKDKSLTKNDYTYNALGQRVPKTTASNTGGALHNE